MRTLRGILAGTLVLAAAPMAFAQGGGSSAGSSGGSIGASSSIGAGSSIGASSSIGTGNRATGSGQGASSGISTLGSATSGGGTGGGTGTGRGGTSTPVIPATADPFRNTYGNPYAIGLSNVTTSFVQSSTGVSGVGFGKAVNTFTATTSIGGAGGGASSTINLNNEGFTTYGIRRAPLYSTVLGDDVPLVKHNPVAVHQTLLSTLSQSTFLKDKGNVRVAVDGDTVLLQGQVANERERRLIEGFVRMTPGVRGVVNELTMVTPPAKSE